MNQERFDDLTRALATGRLSRRQVLKSVAAGVLLAGPLATLFQKVGIAQTLDCVSEKCVKSAQKEYKACNRDCRIVTNSAECLEACQATYSGQLGICGCVTLNTDTTTGEVTYAPCEDRCAPRTLSEQAHQDPHYATLADYLTTDGFAADDEGPIPFVIQEDGQLVRSVLMSSYSNPVRTNEIATLAYFVEASGDTLVFALVQDSQNETLLYLLVVDETGQVQKVIPPEDTPEDPEQTSGPNAVLRAAAAMPCDSRKLALCLAQAARKKSACLTLALFACAVRPDTCRLAALTCEVYYLHEVITCTEQFGCGPVSLSFCSNNVCCGLTETGCGGSCCSFSQTCCNRADGTSVCVDPCEPPTSLDENCECTCSITVSVASASGLVAPLAAASTTPCNGQCCDVCQKCGSNGCEPKCGPCETCNSQNGACEAIPNGKPCGKACCGSCQVCEDASTSKCRNCNGCETCDASGNCVSSGCGSQCQGPCPEGTQCQPLQDGTFTCCGANAYCGPHQCCGGADMVCAVTGACCLQSNPNPDPNAVEACPTSQGMSCCPRRCCITGDRCDNGGFC